MDDVTDIRHEMGKNSALIQVLGGNESSDVSFLSLFPAPHFALSVCVKPSFCPTDSHMIANLLLLLL